MRLDEVTENFSIASEFFSHKATIIDTSEAAHENDRRLQTNRVTVDEP
jgi:hypothetical protein